MTQLPPAPVAKKDPALERSKRSSQRVGSMPKRQPSISSSQSRLSFRAPRQQKRSNSVIPPPHSRKQSYLLQIRKKYQLPEKKSCHTPRLGAEQKEGTAFKSPTLSRVSVADRLSGDITPGKGDYSSVRFYAFDEERHRSRQIKEGLGPATVKTTNYFTNY